MQKRWIGNAVLLISGITLLVIGITGLVAKFYPASFSPEWVIYIEIASICSNLLTLIPLGVLMLIRPNAKPIFGITWFGVIAAFLASNAELMVMALSNIVIGGVAICFYWRFKRQQKQEDQEGQS